MTDQATKTVNYHTVKYHTINYHTVGEPFRIVTGGVDTPEGSTVLGTPSLGLNSISTRSTRSWILAPASFQQLSPDGMFAYYTSLLGIQNTESVAPALVGRRLGAPSRKVY